MKYFVISDIHGSATALEKALSFFYSFGCDKILLLGDILYHGPRNPIPEGYDNKKVCEILNPLKDIIISCRGNCEAEVCQMVLQFPTMQDFSVVVDENKTIFMTHGHIYAPEIKMPDNFDVFFYGHTHVQKLEKTVNGQIICNPGSTTFSKENSPLGFAIYENSKVQLYDLSGRLLKEV